MSATAGTSMWTSSPHAHPSAETMSPAPAGSIRPGTVDDVDAIAAVHVASSLAAYRGHVPVPFLARMDVAQRAAQWREEMVKGPGSGPKSGPGSGSGQGEWWRVLVAASHDRPDAVRGFISYGAEPAASDILGPLIGRVHRLYIEPSAWALGLGSLLLATATEELAGLGLTTARLWTLGSNVRARAFYANHGWGPDGERFVWHSVGIPHVELRYARRLN